MCDLEGIGKEVNKAKSSFSDVLLQCLKLDALSAEDAQWILVREREQTCARYISSSSCTYLKTIMFLDSVSFPSPTQRQSLGEGNWC